MNAKLLKKAVIKPVKNKIKHNFCCRCIKRTPFLKRNGAVKVCKRGKLVISSVIIVKPNKKLPCPQLKVKTKFNRTQKNQVIIINLYKSKNINKPATKNCFKLTKRQNKVLNYVYLVVVGLFIGFINGFWGGGGGMICVPTLTMLLGLSDKKAHATTILIMLPLSIASFIVYMLKGDIAWTLAGVITGGFVLGGVAGALILKKINNTVLRIVFSLVIIAGAIKMLI